MLAGIRCSSFEQGADYETVTYCHGLKIKAPDDWLVNSNRLLRKKSDSIGLFLEK